MISHAGDALYIPTHGRRRPGRQMTSYTAYTVSIIQKLRGDTDNDLNPDAIASLAQDRSDWRMI